MAFPATGPGRNARHWAVALNQPALRNREVDWIGPDRPRLCDRKQPRPTAAPLASQNMRVALDYSVRWASHCRVGMAHFKSGSGKQERTSRRVVKKLDMVRSMNAMDVMDAKGHLAFLNVRHVRS